MVVGTTAAGLPPLQRRDATSPTPPISSRALPLLSVARLYQNVISITAAFVISFVFGSPLLSAVLAGIMPLLVFAGTIQVGTA